MAFFMGIVDAVYHVSDGTINAVDVIMHNYLAWIAVLSMLLLTLTGLDRFIPMFSIPREPEVEFIKN